MQKLFLLLLLQTCYCFIKAQPPAQYNFTHYSTSTGLLSNQVNSVVQDEKGYIWIGCTDGLLRFDGTRYKVFRHRTGDPTTIAANPVLNLLIDKNKNLWLLTADGHAGMFNTSNFTYRDARVRSNNESAVKTGTKRLLTDSDGNIFLLIGANEVLTWNETNNDFSVENNFFSAPPNWGFTAFAQQPGTERYWMGLQGGGLAVFDKATGHLSYAGHNIDHEPAIDRFTACNISSNFLFDKKSRLWFSSWGDGFPYIYCYDVKNQQPVVEKYEFLSELKMYNEVGGFFEQDDGTIWVTGLRVFAWYREKDKKFEMIPAGYVNERSIDYRQIASLYEDREKNIWVGTGNNGMFRFNPSQSFFLNIGHSRKKEGGKGDGNPLCFLRDKDGSILTGIWGEGFYRYDNNLNPVPLNIRVSGDSSFNSVWSMYPSGDSVSTWISAQPGLYRYYPARHTAEFYNPALLENRTVRQVVEDRRGNLWLGMQRIGVFKWNPAKGRDNFDNGILKFAAIPETQINFMTMGKNGDIWICSRQYGLFVVDPDADTIRQHFHTRATGEFQLPEDDVAAVMEYNDSLVVIATATRIMLYNPQRKTSTQLRSSEILSGFIRSLQKDQLGNLWVSTTSALYRINITKRIFINYNRDDGITSDFFMLTASLALPDGRLLFGAAGQFTAFDPAQMAKEKQQRKSDVFITDFRVMNKSLLVDSLMGLKQITLSYSQNSLDIEFSQLAFENLQLVQYKLEDLDKDWVSADKTSQAIYSYLPPGDYRLYFRTLDPEGKGMVSSHSVLISIAPPFWRSWWFFAIAGLLAAALVYWVDRERMHRKAAVLDMRNNIAGNLHEEVNTALGNINILSEMALMKSEKEPEKSQEFIRQINSRSHNMIIAMDDMLWSISPDNDSMDKTVERMREYIDALKNRHGVSIELLIDKNIGKLELNMRWRHEAFVLFKEGIKSLVTAGVSRCAIQIGFGKNKLLFTMQFGNEGCDMQQLNNLLQRRDMEKHLEAINASFDVQVHKTSSVFLLQLPIE